MLPSVKLEFEDVKPHIAAFRRMIRELAFDICELAPTTYVIARAHGLPIIALPVFFVRRFHHRGFLVRPGSGITEPKDLEGRNFGVRAYSVTTGVWKRGLLQNQYGVDISKINWFVDDEEHVESLILPRNVTYLSDNSSLASMMANGELDVACSGDAGIGRVGKPGENWNDGSLPILSNLEELFPDNTPLDRDFYNTSGIYPVHGCLVIKESLLDNNSDFARELFEAFVLAKQPYICDLKRGKARGQQAEKDAKLMDIVGEDPIPYGMDANLPTINALIKYAYQQGLISQIYKPEDMFLPF